MSRRNSKIRLLILLVLMFFIFKGIKIFFSAIRRKQLWLEFLGVSSLSILCLLYFYKYDTLEHFAYSILWVTLFYICYWFYMFRLSRFFHSSNNWMSEKFWRTLDPFDFEDEVAHLFQTAGYKSKVTQERGDFGVDVITNINNVRVAVQCKRYNEHKVTGAQVRELWGAKDYYDCDKVIMIGLDGATSSAMKFVQKFKGNYEFIDLNGLFNLAEAALSNKKFFLFD